MYTSTRKIQTAFRLDEGLVARLKLKAKQKDVSLNRLVEEMLEKVAPAEPEWPKIEFPAAIRPEIKALAFNNGPTKEDINNDERLAYILSKGL
ncbi:MAG: toxin-antitoxin system HicB family antitoxin [Bacteroidales bacterium]|nr:toxin-antitoxin system HicB family antitoxin [Bacteroidales bacterium]